MLEGPHLVAEAVAAGLPLEEVLMTPEHLAGAAGAQLAAALPSPPTVVEGALLAGVTDADSPRGVVAVVALPRHGVEALPRVADGIYLYVDGAQDPGNLGALARVAEAAGAAGMALAPGSVHPNHPRALRASAGSLLRLPLAVDVDPPKLGDHLAPLAPRRVALLPRGGTSLYAAALEAGALVLLLGAEGPGLSPTLAGTADLRLTIPLAPPVESLNVTTAAAVVLFEIRRRRSGP